MSRTREKIFSILLIPFLFSLPARSENNAAIFSKEIESKKMAEIDQHWEKFVSSAGQGQSTTLILKSIADTQKWALEFREHFPLIGLYAQVNVNLYDLEAMVGFLPQRAKDREECLYKKALMSNYEKSPEDAPSERMVEILKIWKKLCL